MTFTWKEDTIRWYRDAEKYTGFFKNVAGVVAPMTAGHSSLCDLGCGLGLIDIALSKHLRRIDCIDKSEAAIASLASDIDSLGITNIYPRVADIDGLNENFDIMLFCFFGSHKLDSYRPLCKKVISVVSYRDPDALMPEKHRKFEKNTVDKTEAYLKENGVEYVLTPAQFEFGQPLRSKDDACAFILSHAPDMTKNELDEFLSGKLIYTGERDFPCYIPRKKRVGIFELPGLL
jgi:hypothetical protein